MTTNITIGVTLLPAILCNSVGVTVSDFEWEQDRQAETWTDRIVDRKSHKTMRSTADRVKHAAQHYQCDLRTTAYGTALDNLAEA